MPYLVCTLWHTSLSSSLQHCAPAIAPSDTAHVSIPAVETLIYHNIVPCLGSFEKSLLRFTRFDDRLKQWAATHLRYRPALWNLSELWAALNIEVLIANEIEMRSGLRSIIMQREIRERTKLQLASSGTIPTCENPRAIPTGIEPGSPWWEANSVTVTPLTLTPDSLRGRGVYSGLTTRFPPRRTGFDTRRGRFKIFACGDRAGTMQQAGGFSRGSPVSTSLACRCYSSLHFSVLSNTELTGGQPFWSGGATVAERRSGFNPWPGHSGFSHVGIVPDDAADRQVFLGISRFLAILFRCCSVLISVTLIGSQDLDVKSCPNLFTHSGRAYSTSCRQSPMSVNPRRVYSAGARGHETRPDASRRGVKRTAEGRTVDHRPPRREAKQPSTSRLSFLIIIPPRTLACGISRLPPPWHFGAAPYSHHFAVISSQDPDVKSRPNLSTYHNSSTMSGREQSNRVRHSKTRNSYQSMVRQQLILTSQRHASPELAAPQVTRNASEPVA
ncbi:hypothetical protein PR048_010237 [Dryococelus australis]|uniref:Uncharacterized protein n=1 Tax=Dryococelus australis TaxID=614101 RepID=A0ABQ9I279_9NEOP|nr:hypothetical protein PR048_010237 [Dryococelus australis]